MAMILSPIGTPATEVPAEPVATEAPVAEEAPIVVAVWSGPSTITSSKLLKNIQKQPAKKSSWKKLPVKATFHLNTVAATCGEDYDAFYAMSDFVPAYVAADGLKDLNTFFENPDVPAPTLT